MGRKKKKKAKRFILEVGVSSILLNDGHSYKIVYKTFETFRSGILFKSFPNEFYS